MHLKILSQFLLTSMISFEKEHLHCCFPVGDILFSLLLNIFSFVFNFWRFYYNMSWHKLLCVYPVEGLLNFFSIYKFMTFIKSRIFQALFLQIFFLYHHSFPCIPFAPGGMYTKTAVFRPIATPLWENIVASCSSLK